MVVPQLTQNIAGILWMLLAGLLFSGMVALVKLLGARLPSFEIVFFRSAIQLVFLASVFWRIGFASLKTSRPLLQAGRALLAVVLINCNFYAFTQLPVADVTAIGFSRNLFLVLLAIFLLGEQVNVHRLLVTVVGFVGILIIVRPGYGDFAGAAWIALAGAGLGATMMILIRKLTATDSNMVMMTYPALAIVLATSVPACLVWVTPTAKDLVLLFSMAVMGISGQWCLIQAFRLGEASAVAPASYVRLVYASLIGYYVFDEMPDVLMAVGAIIVVGSNLYLVFQEGRLMRPGPGEPVPGDVT